MTELGHVTTYRNSRESLLSTMEAALSEVEATLKGSADARGAEANEQTNDLDGLPTAGRVAGVETSRTRGNTGMTALKQATVVMVTGLLLTAGGCVTAAKHAEVESQLSATQADLAAHQRTLAEARDELVQITALVDQLDTARRVAKVDVQQAMASVEKLKAWVTNTVAAVSRLESAYGDDDKVMRDVDSQLASLVMKLSTLASKSVEAKDVRVADAEKKK